VALDSIFLGLQNGRMVSWIWNFMLFSMFLWSWG